MCLLTSLKIEIFILIVDWLFSQCVWIKLYNKMNSWEICARRASFFKLDMKSYSEILHRSICKKKKLFMKFCLEKCIRHLLPILCKLSIMTITNVTLNWLASNSIIVKLILCINYCVMFKRNISVSYTNLIQILQKLSHFILMSYKQAFNYDKCNGTLEKEEMFMCVYNLGV